MLQDALKNTLKKAFLTNFVFFDKAQVNSKFQLNY
jgi:hypothetical protein